MKSLPIAVVALLGTGCLKPVDTVVGSLFNPDCDGVSANSPDADAGSGADAGCKVSDWCSDFGVGTRSCASVSKVECGADVISFAVDADWVAWTDSGGDVWLRAKAGPADAGRRISHGSPAATAATLQGGHLYWGRGTTLARAPVDGGAIELMACRIGYVLEIAVQPPYIYWGSYGSPQGSDIRRVGLKGGAADRLVGIDSASHFTLDDTSLYWTNIITGTVYRAPIDGGTGVPLHQQQHNPTSPQLSEGRLYWTEGVGPNHLQRAAVTGGAAETVFLTSGSDPITALALEPGKAFVIAGNTVRALPLDGGPGEILFGGQSAPRALVIQGPDLYISTSTGIWKTPQ